MSVRSRLRDLPSVRDLNPIVVGLVAIILGGALVAGVFAVATLGWFEDRYRLSAVFESTGGMKSGAAVRVAGVNVGTVDGVHPDFERGQVVVTFEVDSGIDLGVETRAEIAATTLLGGYYLRLTGPVQEPYLNDLPTDDARRRIPLERTVAPLSLVKTLSDTTSAVQAIDIESVNRVLEQVAGATHRNADVIPTLIDSIATVGAALASREDTLRALAEQAGTVTSSLAARDDELVRLVDAAAVLLDTLAERRDELAVTLGAGSDAVAELTDTITAHRAAIDKILADVHVFLDGVERNVSLVNESLAYAGPLLTLLGATRNPTGGFDVAVEGFVVNMEQFRNLLDVLFPSPVGPS
jgi:phospholipid/cholesterol/gamma-HCH transport system substrate-binding protein